MEVAQRKKSELHQSATQKSKRLVNVTMQSGTKLHTWGGAARISFWLPKLLKASYTLMCNRRLMQLNGDKCERPEKVCWKSYPQRSHGGTRIWEKTWRVTVGRTLHYFSTMLGSDNKKQTKNVWGAHMLSTLLCSSCLIFKVAIVKLNGGRQRATHTIPTFAQSKTAQSFALHT